MHPTHNIEAEGLHVLANAKKFNKWMYSSIQPFVSGNILEIGSGIGNISTYFIINERAITLSDTEIYYINFLTQKFSSNPLVKEILNIDLQVPNFQIEYLHLKNNFDSVFLLNVLEHIEDESYAIQNLNFLLKENGSLIILVPAYKFLYSEMDKELKHYRRYTTKKLAAVVRNENFEITKSFYFNFMGIPAWFYGKIRKYKNLPAGDMGFYDKLTPIGKLLDRIVFRKMGLSAVTVAKKIK